MLLNAARMLEFLALGDSYTIGESVAERERWPVQLAARLNDRGIAVSPPLILAQTGWTTDELAAAIVERKPGGSYDLVTLLIGVNNQYRGRSIEEYRDEFQLLLEQAVRFAGGRPGQVIALSIPDWGITPFAAGRDRAAISQDIDRFNAVNRKIAREAGVRYVDVTGISRQAAREPGLIAEDGLHPSGEMYRLWVERVLPDAQSALDQVRADVD